MRIGTGQIDSESPANLQRTIKRRTKKKSRDTLFVKNVKILEVSFQFKDSKKVLNRKMSKRKKLGHWRERGTFRSEKREQSFVSSEKNAETR